MDSNNWRQPPQPDQPPMDVGVGDWRSQLQPDSRHRIVNKIMDTLKRHLPSSGQGQEGAQELYKIAIRFEEKIYRAATSQSEYLRRISLKMLSMESKSNSPMPNSMPSNSAGMSRNPQDSDSSLHHWCGDRGTKHGRRLETMEKNPEDWLRVTEQKFDRMNELLDALLEKRGIRYYGHGTATAGKEFCDCGSKDFKEEKAQPMKQGQ